MSRRTWRRAFVALTAALALSACIPAPSVSAGTVETFGDYSMMFSRSAGQYWTGSQVGGQWAWSPQSTTESRISWGDPAHWPPSYQERFLHVADTSGDWVRLDGWWDNGTYYTLRVTDEAQYAPDCASSKQPLPVGGAQHYVRWNIPATGYCLIASGIITEQSSGKVIHFRHLQTWALAGSCANAFLSARPCLAQGERWWDDNGTTFAEKLCRTSMLAKGVGMAWQIKQYRVGSSVVTWTTDLKYYWGW